jgi:6-phosphogluconolactonase
MQTGNGAHCIFTDSDNSHALLPHIAGERGINTILKYNFDEDTGMLSPSEREFVKQPDNRGPRHYTFHPSGEYVFFSNEQDSSVTSYRYHEGDMEELYTISTLPAHYAGVNTCAQIKITPDGKFLYAPNRGHNSLAGFSINSNSGQLKAIGRTLTEAIPRVLDIDGKGQFLYSAGLETGFISAFRISDTGNLQFIERFEVGKEPMWILILPVSE